MARVIIASVIMASVTIMASVINLWQVCLMASVTYGKCIMVNVIMANIFITKILWQMKLSRSTTIHCQSLPLTKFMS